MHHTDKYLSPQSYEHLQQGLSLHTIKHCTEVTSIKLSHRLRLKLLLLASLSQFLSKVNTEMMDQEHFQLQNCNRILNSGNEDGKDHNPPMDRSPKK